MHSQSPIRNPSKPQTGKKSSLIWVLLILFSAGIFFVTASLGVLGGYQTGLREYSRLQSLEEIKFLQEQYLLAVLLLAGNNRYEPILPSVFIENDPDLKKLSDAMWVGFEEAHGSGNGFWMLIR